MSDQEGGNCHRNRREFRVDHRRLEGIDGERSLDLSGNPQGVLLQRQALSLCVKVYNFQTDTGNYFADRILVHNCDLHAIHIWLVDQTDSLQARLEAGPEWFDPKVAGRWLWGMACWIGSGFCSGNGPWQVAEADDGSRQLVHLGNAGQGVHRKRENHRENLFAYFAALSERLRHVRVCCGDWTRVMGGASGEALGWHFQTSGTSVGVFLDPPYADTAKRNPDLYRVDSESVAHAVREWAIAHGDDPRYRICVAGYEGEHTFPGTWPVAEGKGGRGHGYGCQSKNGYENKDRERLWFSPGCLDPEEVRMPLFAALEKMI